MENFSLKKKGEIPPVLLDKIILKPQSYFLNMHISTKPHSIFMATFSWKDKVA